MLLRILCNCTRNCLSGDINNFPSPMPWTIGLSEQDWHIGLVLSPTTLIGQTHGLDGRLQANQIGVYKRPGFRHYTFAHHGIEHRAPRPVCEDSKEIALPTSNCRPRPECRATFIIESTFKVGSVRYHNFRIASVATRASVLHYYQS